MSNQQTNKKQYVVTSQFFQAYGGAIDESITKYVNEYAEANNVRFINVVCNAGQFVFFWAAK